MDKVCYNALWKKKSILLQSQRTGKNVILFHALFNVLNWLIITHFEEKIVRGFVKNMPIARINYY